LLAKALSGVSIEKTQLKSLTAKYSDISERPLPDDYYYDFGADELFFFGWQRTR
jgi:hypothetical protein